MALFVLLYAVVAPCKLSPVTHARPVKKPCKSNIQCQVLKKYPMNSGKTISVSFGRKRFVKLTHIISSGIFQFDSKVIVFIVTC